MTHAVIGGTGFYSMMDDFKIIRREIIHTPYGEPSGPVVHGEMHGKPIIFLARHGYTHRIPPHKINYRANIWMMKKLGVEKIIAINAVGGISSDLAPEVVALPDQLIDYTYNRKHTFFEEDLSQVVHTDFTYPFTISDRDNLIKAATEAQINVVTKGTYVCTQGPRLETAAEIKKYALEGCNMVGMTAMPEAILAREKGIDYSSIALSVNWAAGIQNEIISMEQISKHVNNGMQQVNQLISVYIKSFA
ncbi:MAG: S-methyl-5'-thioinosine phosphorylase [Gammaproteobacteria bacterium]|nr:S-methyl-5'-thioinosine phosphorylase [Gammaproteobacteria bacterium]